MDALSLQEATGTYNGFILMAMVMSILRWVPVVLTLYSVAHAFLLVDSGSAVATQHFTRIAAGIVVIMLFFPGPFGIGVAVSPAEFAAIRVDVDNRTRASDAPENTIRDGAVITGIGTKAVVTGIGQAWVNLGLAITAQIRDSDSDAMALQRLFHAPLSASTLGVVRDWADRCVVPAKHRALTRGGGTLTAGDLQPFGSGAIASEMGTILVRPGRLNGSISATFPFLYSQITCAEYRSQMQSRVQDEFASRTDAQGRPLSALWNDRLGLSVAQATEVAVFRETERVLGPAVPAHSLRTVFQVTSAIGGVASNPVAVLGAFTAGTAVTGGFGGFGTAGVVAGAAQLSAMADRMLTVLGPALIITEFSTYLFGLLQTVPAGSVWRCALLCLTSR